jgi:heme/copper-type cytochrome/quinol oxidase subunit 2
LFYITAALFYIYNTRGGAKLFKIIIVVVLVLVVVVLVVLVLVLVVVVVVYHRKQGRGAGEEADCAGRKEARYFVRWIDF